MAGNSFECCKRSSDGYNFCSGSSQKNPYSEDAYSDDPYRHLNASWYQQLWSQYWWSLNNQHSRHMAHTVHQARNHFPTWCSTCVEEREQRKRRVNLRKGGRCDNNFSLGKQTSSEPLFKNMSSRNQIQGEQGLQQFESTGVTEAHPTDTEESSSDEFEMELNNDFKKFLEQSAKHKEERKKEAILSQVKTDDYIEAGEIALQATTVAPTQQQGTLRTEEMKSLYGESAHRIESLETSLQLHFNMNVDMRHPVFWPSIPMKF